MNPAELQQKLIAAARATPPAEHVPYAFEKRIMARLEGRAAVDAWGLWGRALSRAAMCCVAFMLLLSGAAYFMPNAGSQEPLAQDVDQTLYAAVGNSNTDQDAE